MLGGGLVSLGLGLGGLGHVELVVGGRDLLDAGDVARGIDGGDEAGDVHARRVEADGRGLGREVDVRLLDALDLAEEAGDAVDARGARHPLDGERDDLDRGGSGCGHRGSVDTPGESSCTAVKSRRRGYSMRIVAVNIPMPHMYWSVPGSIAGSSITLSPGSRIFSMPRSGTTR